MALTANKLVKQVDLPVWEWGRPLPVASAAGLSCSAAPDNMDFSVNTGRYIYALLNATNFWRYDTVADSYLQMASPGVTPLTATSMRFAGSLGYFGRVIDSPSSTTINTGLPYGPAAVGYRIRITSGKGAGQERIITSVSDPIIADFGGATAGAATSLTDANKNWGWTGTANNVNNWIGYVVRVVGGTGLNQVRKIIYNSSTVLTVADANINSYDQWSLPMVSGAAGWTAPAAGSLYQIEYSTLTVDTAWSIQPDSTSRYVIQSGGIWLASGATVANGGVTVQYYSVLEDVWYAKSVNNSMVPGLLTENSLERFTENSSLWYTGQVSTGTNAALTDTSANWTVDQWKNYELFFWTGAGKGQLVHIASNTTNQLTFDSTLTNSIDTSTRYSILGYDGGILSTSTARVLQDEGKTWTLNQWANYAVRIIAGTGDGQQRQILSNGTDTLVVYDGWNIQPDNTSKYVIQSNTQDMLITLGSNSETFIYRTDTDVITHGRPLDEGIIQVACAMLTDGTSTSTHEIYEQKPVAISSLSGSGPITATTAQSHQFKVGQWVSIRGVTSAAADVYNVTGKVQILTVPSVTAFTYSPFATGTGAYQLSNNVAIGVSVLPDASKYHADVATGGSTTSVTFTRAQPSNINGWYVYGTNIGAGAQIVSGAGTTTLTLNITGAGTPTGTITMTKWPQPVTATYSSGGGAGVFSATFTGNVPAYVKGWLVSGTGIGIGAYVTGGEGTNTINFSLACTGAPSGTITFSHPVNNILPETRTYSSGSGSSITLTTDTPSHINGWWVSGTNIANGTVVTGGQGTATITLSNSTSGTPSGTITFYPPTQVPAMIYGTSAAPTVSATGALAGSNAMQLTAPNVNNSSIMTPLSAVTAAAAGISRYVVARRNMLGQNYSGQNLYLSGVATGGSTTTLVDANAFWATATGSGGSAGAFTFTISAPGSIIHNGWYVSGTNIPIGARVVSGGGTTSITIDMPLSGTVSGPINFTAWTAQNLIGRRLRVVSATGANQDLPITVVAPATGTITFGAAVAPGAGASSYTILPTIVPGAGASLQWLSNSSIPANRGRYVLRFRGGAQQGIDKLDITNDQLTIMYTVPIAETLTTGSMYAYDQMDRIYFTKDLTNRVYYLDVTNNTIYGSGVFPYLAGATGLGNKMEIFKTVDGLKYLWINRQQQVETFRALIFW